QTAYSRLYPTHQPADAGGGPVRRDRRDHAGLLGPAADLGRGAGPRVDRQGPGGDARRPQGHLQPPLRAGSRFMKSEQEELPPFAEQMAQQLGGWRGLIESGIPVAVFVVLNVVAGWFSKDTRFVLEIAIAASVGTALVIAAVRL